jgi:hypothetical protein
MSLENEPKRRNNPRHPPTIGGKGMDVKVLDLIILLFI